MKKYQAGTYIEITFLIMWFVWTVRNVFVGDILNSVIGLGMLLYGHAALLYQKDKHNKLIDAVTIGGLLFLIAYYFIIKK